LAAARFAHGEEKASEAAGGARPAAGGSAETPAVDRAADEAAIRSSIASFTDAFNAKDAKAISELFAPEAQIITEDGETVEGREAILQAFGGVFEEMPDVEMEVFVDTIRFVGSDLAVEVGSTKETPAPGETPEYSRYTVLHAKRDGKWIMTIARDTAGEPPTNHERLQPLTWLVGEWIDDDGSSVVHTSCRWSDDENFLLQDIRLQIDGNDAMQVTQRIGWDPLNKRVRSWAFDTEGGFTEGVWARDGDSWVIKSTGVRPDGIPASATSTIVPTGNDGYVWRVTDRVIGDEVQPPLEVKVVRKPPQPKEN
jgi:uncharacterized protein (TIGR02246 family)